MSPVAPMASNKESPKYTKDPNSDRPRILDKIKTCTVT